MGEGEAVGNGEGGGCQRWDEKTRSGRKAGAVGTLGGTWRGRAPTRSCLLWTAEATCWELECVLAPAAGTELSDQGRPGQGGCLSLFLKAQHAMNGLHFPRLCPLSGRRLRSAPRSREGHQGRSGPLGLSLVPGVVWPGGQGW